MDGSFVSHWFGPNIPKEFWHLVVPCSTTHHHTIGFGQPCVATAIHDPILVWEHPVGLGSLERGIAIWMKYQPTL